MRERQPRIDWKGQRTCKADKEQGQPTALPGGGGGGGDHLLQGQKTPEETTYGGVCNPFTWEREWTGSFLDPWRG